MGLTGRLGKAPARRPARVALTGGRRQLGPLQSAPSAPRAPEAHAVDTLRRRQPTPPPARPVDTPRRRPSVPAPALAAGYDISIPPFTGST